MNIPNSGSQRWCYSVGHQMKQKLENMGKIFVRKKEADSDRKEIKGERDYLNCVIYIYVIVQEQNGLR